MPPSFTQNHRLQFGHVPRKQLAAQAWGQSTDPVIGANNLHRWDNLTIDMKSDTAEDKSKTGVLSDRKAQPVGYSTTVNADGKLYPGTALDLLYWGLGWCTPKATTDSNSKPTHLIELRTSGKSLGDTYDTSEAAAATTAATVPAYTASDVLVPEMDFLVKMGPYDKRAKHTVCKEMTINGSTKSFITVKASGIAQETTYDTGKATALTEDSTAYASNPWKMNQASVLLIDPSAVSKTPAIFDFDLKVSWSYTENWSTYTNPMLQNTPEVTDVKVEGSMTLFKHDDLAYALEQSEANGSHWGICIKLDNGNDKLRLCIPFATVEAKEDLGGGSKVKLNFKAAMVDGGVDPFSTIRSELVGSPIALVQKSPLLYAMLHGPISTSPIRNF